LHALLFAAILSAGAAAAPPARLPAAAPAAAGMSAERLSLIDAAVAESIGRKECPGAVVLVGRRGRVVFRKAYGNRTVLPKIEPMTVDTVFDMASLTKPLATATSVMILIEEGKLRLADRVAKLLPEFAAGGGARDQVTVEELLTHRAGLAADDPMALYVGTPKEIFERKFREPLVCAPGSRFLYSDAGFEVLGEIVRRVSSHPLGEFARQRVFIPLAMSDTEFRPGGKGNAPLSRIAPTEKINGEIRRGAVHDPRAFALGGVAGHAGLFSTADDLARFAFAMLKGGTPVLSPAGVTAMTRPRSYGDGDLRALGWDVATSYASNRGDLFPLGSYGHTGWTGTSLWIDPATQTFVILLSNRNHPDESGNVVALRGKVASIVASSITDAKVDDLRQASERIAILAAVGTRQGTSGEPSARASNEKEREAAPVRLVGQVRPGIDALEEKSFKQLSGLRIALLTNQTGQTRDGRPTIDVLISEKAKKAGVTLVRLFSPEHGIRGLLDENVGDAKDEKTGLPIRSLYGDTKESRRPKREDLAGLDALVVDLQDAGARYYTYLTTMGYLLEEAAKAKVRVLVLDRPDPITAEKPEGPLADEDKLSFVAYHPIPVRTGMTIGELALLFNAERRIGANLSIVKLVNYSRDLWYDETGLPWTNPSPNLRSVTQAALYPGVGLLEATNVSVGRGTDSPFEQIGAPWMDGARMSATLIARSLPGLRFTPVRFTPASSVYKGEACSGVRITLVDRKALDAVALGIHLMTALRDLHPKEWETKNANRLLLSDAAMTRLLRGETAAEIIGGWTASRMEFERRRAAYLLY
ncbi:MAG: exo-beta-N-acetylmuramidase NamZ domain-containing protein, partial [Thermoanaerobaculia bacterium]